MWNTFEVTYIPVFVLRMARLSLFACGLLVLNYVSVCSGKPCTQMSACTANCDGKKIDVSSLYKAVYVHSNTVYIIMYKLFSIIAVNLYQMASMTMYLHVATRLVMSTKMLL